MTTADILTLISLQKNYSGGFLEKNFQDAKIIYSAIDLYSLDNEIAIQALNINSH